MATKKKPKTIRPHRYLFDKVELIRKATAALVLNPKSAEAAEYLRGLCDMAHGTTDKPCADAIHTARQVIIAGRATGAINVRG